MDTLLKVDIQKNLFVEAFVAQNNVHSINPFLSMDKLVKSLGLSFERLTLIERDQVILKILNTLKVPSPFKAGKNKNNIWEKGWREVFENIQQNGVSEKTLRPQYFQYDIIRFGKDFAKVFDKCFEYLLYNEVRKVFFKKYLAPYDKIYDFGCGTGTTLLILAKLFPGKKLIGCDWVKSSSKIIEFLSESLSLPIQAQEFNMLNCKGQENINSCNKTAFITTHSMEQLGENYNKFLEFIVRKRPGICLHIEPIIELYDSKNLYDYLAMEYHKKRNYLSGFLPKLLEWQKDKKIEIQTLQRLNFGSLFHEGYTLIAWNFL